ncbi:MAG: hypothetical protein ACP5E4_02560 [Candidatus Aenigmatarchaeota archaeon]
MYSSFIAGSTGIFDLVNAMQAPAAIKKAAEDGIPPIRYVLERFLGEENKYGVGFNAPNSWNGRFPEDHEAQYSGQEALQDAMKTAKKYNALLKETRGESNYTPVEVEGAFLKDGTPVGYFISGFENPGYEAPKKQGWNLLEKVGLNKSSAQNIDLGGVLFDPMAVEMGLAIYLMEFDDGFELKSEIQETSRKGRSLEEIKAAIEDRPETKRHVTRKYAIREGFHKNAGLDSVNGLNTLISQRADCGGKPIFEGQKTDDTGLGVLAQVPKETSLWSIFAEKEGSKQNDFDTYLEHAFDLEPG